MLFGNGFEETIRPKGQPQGLCTKWQSVPRDFDYLTTSVKMVKDLFETAGCSSSQKYLTPTRLQWDRGTSLLFEPCPTPAEPICSCGRLQRIVPRKHFGRIVPPGKLENDGAVIFGHVDAKLQTKRKDPSPRVEKSASLSVLVGRAVVNGSAEEGVGDADTETTSTSSKSRNSVLSPLGIFRKNRSNAFALPLR